MVTCGTNRVLSEQRDTLHIAMDNVVSTATDPGDPRYLTCMSSECFNQVFATLNATLNSLPENYLHTRVNDTELHALLEKIPYPTAAHGPKASDKTPGVMTVKK